MGLSYLSKKSWHPSTFRNIEVVWTAEHKKKQEEQRQAEHIKKLKEERQIEELRQLQVMAKVIPESSLQRIEWMYQDRAAQQNGGAQPGHAAEDYLLGKSVKELNGEGGCKNGAEEDFKKKITPVIRGDNFTTSENEAFLKMMEDPLVLIKSRELDERNKQLDNPITMKQIMRDIEKLKKGHKKSKKKDKKKDKKDKKHKKDKKNNKNKRDNSSDSDSDDNERSRKSNKSSKHSRRDSRSSSSESRGSNLSSSSEPTKDRSKRHSGYSSEKSHHSHATSHHSRRSRSRSPLSPRRHKEGHHRDRRDEDGDRRRNDDKHTRDNRDHHRDYKRRSRTRSPIDKSNSKRQDKLQQQNLSVKVETQDLGPDMKIYGEKARLLELNQQLRRKQQHQSEVDSLTPEERDRRLREMMDYAKQQDEQRNLKLFGQTKVPTKETAEEIMQEQRERRMDKQLDDKNASFLKDINSKAYMESGISLEDRIGRNKHYIGRDAKRE